MSKIRNNTKKPFRFSIAAPGSNQPMWYNRLHPGDDFTFADGNEWVININND